MAAQCEKLWLLLTSDMQEAKENVLKIDNFSYEAVLAFLEYLYCGEFDIDKYSFDFLFELLHISDEYLMEDLYKICHKKLKSKINVNNVCEILVAADGMNLKELKTQCLDMIVASFSEIIGKESYNKLVKHPHLLLEITKEIANQLNPAAE